MRTVLAFGVLYTLILLAASAAREALGGRGLVAVAAISVMTDVDTWRAVR